MTIRERLCKWTLLWLLLFSVLRPILKILDYDLINTTYTFDALLFFMLIVTVVQGIIGVIAWFMINRDNEKGKNLLIGTYAVTCGLYGLYFLFLTVLWILPNTIFYPFEYISILTLFGFSAAVLLLQHFWTKYLF